MNEILAVIANREASSMASVWREYLCLRAGGAKHFQVFIGGYQSLDEASKYFNENTEDYEIPEKIGDHLVQGIEDEWIVGGELDFYDDDDQVEFDTINDAELIKWLSKNRWLDALSKLNEAVSRPASGG